MLIYLEELHKVFEPESDLIEGFEEFEVEAIFDYKRANDGSWYLVRWKGYLGLHNSWEPGDNLTNCGSILIDFKKSRKLDLQQIGNFLGRDGL